MDQENIISKILEGFFLAEPALFAVLCTHAIVQNSTMACAVRCGKMRLEYNPDMLSSMSEDEITDYIKTEAIRILLLHPYQRKPLNCSDASAALASNIVIGDNYRFNHFSDTPEAFGLQKHGTYEEYAIKIENGCTNTPVSNTQEGTGDTYAADKYKDLAELWDEDSFALQEITNTISSINNWGSITGDLVERIRANMKAKVDFRKVFAGFRGSVLASERTATRMRPNRRTEFDNPGYKRKYTTRMLVAIDTSGSISSKSLEYFLGVCNNAFRLGFKSIDIAQFDTEIKAVTTLRKAMSGDNPVFGRGGTNFQCVVDFAKDNSYDALVILTDGCADPPCVKDRFKSHILWVCENQLAYNMHKEWMTKLGRACAIDLK